MMFGPGLVFSRVRVGCSLASLVILSLSGRHLIFPQNIMGVGPPNFEFHSYSRLLSCFLALEVGRFSQGPIGSGTSVSEGEVGLTRSAYRRWRYAHFMRVSEMSAHFHQNFLSLSRRRERERILTTEQKHFVLRRGSGPKAARRASKQKVPE